MNTDSGELKLHFLDYWRVIRVRLPLIILVFLLVLITAGVVTYLTPKQYASSVTMQIKLSDTQYQIFATGQQQGFDARFLSTQFEIMKRKESLYPVIETLQLDQRWALPSREQAYYRLQSMIDMHDVRNTELIQIVVYSGDPKEAAEIANAIADGYERKRVGDQAQWVSRSLVQLQQEVDKQQAKVEELKAKSNNLRKQLEIVDLNPDSIEEAATAENQIVMAVEQQVSSERLRVASLRAKYEQVSRMTDEQIMQSLTTLELVDPTISTILPQYQSAMSEEARMLEAGYGRKHPTFKSLWAKKEVMERQLKDQVLVLRKTLHANFQIAEDSLKALETSLDQSRSSQQASRTKFAPYYEAKSDYIQAKRLLEAAQARLQTEQVQRTMPLYPTKVWERAEPSFAPAKPKVWVNMALGAVVGIVFGVGLAFFIEYLDTSVKTMEDIETFLQVPVLAVIPRKISILMNSSPDNPDAEAYRILRTNIEFNRKNPEANSVTIVSGGTGEGKSTTLANLAFTFAAGGYSTLVVDADLRRPSQHRLFGVANDIGLTDYLTGKLDLEEVIVQSKTDNLFFLPSGNLPADAVGVLNSQRMIEFIEEVKGRFDMVFFDSPPILGVSDASVLSSAVDLTIIVVQHRRFPRAMLHRVKQAILNVSGNILGVVLNNVDVRHDQHYEYYTSYYNYYYQRPKRANQAKEQSGVPAAIEQKSSAHTDDEESY